MNDLVKRLRGLADCDPRAGEPLGRVMREAADRIEELERQLDAAHARGFREGAVHAHKTFAIAALKPRDDSH